MSAQDKATKFEEGKVYYARSICDYDTIIRVKIKRITPKMVKYVELDIWGDEEVKNRKVVSHETSQTFSAGAGFTVSSNNLSGSAECSKEIEPAAEAAAEAVLGIQEPKAALVEPADNSESEAKRLAIAAEIIGWQAFKDGKKCVPALDRNLDSLLENLPSGTSLAIMIYTRWIKGWTGANLAAPVVCEEEAPAMDNVQDAREKPEEPKAELKLESNMTIDNPDYSLLEANGVWGGEFRGQWKYKIWYKNPRFFKSADKGLALGYAVASYNEIPIAERIATKEEAYDRVNRARYDKLDGIFGRYSMDELGDLMQRQKALSGSLFNSSLNGMDARPFSVARNRSHRLQLSVGYVGEEIANLAFYMEERAKIEAQHQTA
jgi:hypothetical protein